MDVDIIIYIMSHTQLQGDFDHSDVVVNRPTIILVKCINEAGTAAELKCHLFNRISMSYFLL